jgi:cell division protein FtsB
MFKSIRIFIKRSFLKQIILAIIGFLLIGLISQPLYKTIKKKYLINNEINNLKNEINSYQSKNGQLDSLIKYLESDQYIEEQARKNLGLVKEGESVIVLKNNNDTKDVKNMSNGYVDQKVYDIGGKGSEVKQKITNPIKWISYFLK